MLAPLVIRWYLPFFRRLSTASAYEYLEHRFNLLLRLYASAAFIIFQMGRMAIVIFLPSLAISTVSGIDLTLSVLLMGGVCTFYTMLGGIEGVIWNDVIQAVVMVGSALACIVMVMISLDGSLFELAAEAWHDGKLQTLDWSWSYVYATTWLIVGGSFFNNLVPYTSDQTVIQRYITTKDEAAARRSIWLNGIISPPSALVFFGLGSALYLYYKHQPQALHPEVAPDSLLPLFAVEVMPMGMAGVVIAGIFAASQSSVSSSLNSVATVCITDILGRRLAASSDNRRLFLARAATGLTGVISTVAALVIATRNISSFLDAYLAIVALTGSGLAALFALGIFTRTGNALGATVGVIGSALVLFAVTKFTSLHFFLYGVIGFSTCAALGWTVSWLTGGSRKQLSGLTIRD
jgi:SSS family transporter